MEIPRNPNWSFMDTARFLGTFEYRKGAASPIPYESLPDSIPLAGVALKAYRLHIVTETQGMEAFSLGFRIETSFDISKQYSGLIKNSIREQELKAAFEEQTSQGRLPFTILHGHGITNIPMTGFEIRKPEYDPLPSPRDLASTFGAVLKSDTRVLMPFSMIGARNHSYLLMSSTKSPIHTYEESQEWTKWNALVLGAQWDVIIRQFYPYQGREEENLSYGIVNNTYLKHWYWLKEACVGNKVGLFVVRNNKDGVFNRVA